MELNKQYWKMKNNRGLIYVCIVATVVTIVSSCTISYKMNGASIDYTKIKSISIADFTNTSELVYAPLAQRFSDDVRNVYTRQTRLQVLRTGGDMHLEGEITGYVLTPMAVGADSYSSMTKLTVTFNVRFTNNKNPDEDFEKRYTTFRDFDSKKNFDEVQDDLLKEIIDEVCDLLYNDTVARWDK